MSMDYSIGEIMKRCLWFCTVLLVLFSCQKGEEQYQHLKEGSWKVVSVEVEKGFSVINQDYLSSGIFSYFYTFTDTFIEVQQFITDQPLYELKVSIKRKGNSIACLFDGEVHYYFDIVSRTADTLILKQVSKGGTQPLSVLYTFTKQPAISDTFQKRESPEKLMSRIKEDGWQLIDYACINIGPDAQSNTKEAKEERNRAIKNKIKKMKPTYFFFDSFIAKKQLKTSETGVEDVIHAFKAKYGSNGFIYDYTPYGKGFLKHDILTINRDTAFVLTYATDNSVSSVFTMKRVNANRDSIYDVAVQTLPRY